MNEEETRLNSTAWMRIELGSNAERREKNSVPPRPHPPLKSLKTGATSPKFEPLGRSRSPGAAEPRSPGAERWRRLRRRLTPDFVGVGLLAPRHRGEDDDGGGGVDDDDDDDEQR